MSEKTADARLDNYLDAWLGAGAAVSDLLHDFEPPAAEVKEFDLAISGREQKTDPPFYPLCAGADGLSAAFSRREWGFCLVSNRDPSSVSVILNSRGLAEWLDEGRHFLNLSQGVGGVGVSKETNAATPLLEEFLTSQSVNLCHAAWIGDSVTDVIAARKLGVRMIGLANGMAPESDLWQAGADVVVPDLRTAIDELDQWARTARF